VSDFIVTVPSREITVDILPHYAVRLKRSGWPVVISSGDGPARIVVDPNIPEGYRLIFGHICIMTQMDGPDKPWTSRWENSVTPGYTDSIGRTIRVGDRIRFRGRVYTIMGFRPGEGTHGTAAIELAGLLHVDEVPDEISVDLVEEQ
jgi:hypothetical protein